MATGYKLNNVDFEDIFEKTRDSDTDNMANINTSEFKQSKAGLTLLSDFITIGTSPSNVYQSVANGGSIDISSELIQTPGIVSLVKKGRRPRIASPSWTFSYATTGSRDFHVSRGSYAGGEERISFLSRPWSGGAVPGTIYTGTSFGASDFPEGKIPDVLFYVISGGGGGGAGGGWGIAANGGGGGGGAAFAIGWMYTFSVSDPQYHPEFILNVGGSGGSWGWSGSSGGNGGKSQIINSAYDISPRIVYTNLGGGRGGAKKSGGGGGTATNYNSLATRIGSYNGASGGGPKKEGNDTYAWMTIASESYRRGSHAGGISYEGDFGGSGGASAGNGGSDTNGYGYPDSGGGGGGGSGGIGEANNGRPGAPGTITFFY